MFDEKAASVELTLKFLRALRGTVHCKGFNRIFHKARCHTLSRGQLIHFSVQCKMCSVYFVVFSVQWACIVHCAVFSVHSAVCTVHCALCNLQCAPCTVHCAVYSVQCAVHCV